LEAKRSCISSLKCSSDSLIRPEIPITLIETYREFWGKPLPSNMTQYQTEIDGMRMMKSMDISGDYNSVNYADQFSGLGGGPYPIYTTLTKKLLVLTDYLRVFESIQIYNQLCDGKEPAILTGQPGTGKTFWISYALSRLLGEKSEVALYKDKRKEDLMLYGLGSS